VFKFIYLYIYSTISREILSDVLRGLGFPRNPVLETLV